MKIEKRTLILEKGIQMVKLTELGGGPRGPVTLRIILRLSETQ